MKMMTERKKYKFLKWFIIYFKIHGHITSISVLRSYRKLGLAAKLMIAAHREMEVIL